MRYQPISAFQVTRGPLYAQIPLVNWVPFDEDGPKINLPFNIDKYIYDFIDRLSWGEKDQIIIPYYINGHNHGNLIFKLEDDWIVTDVYIENRNHKKIQLNDGTEGNAFIDNRKPHQIGMVRLGNNSFEHIIAVLMGGGTGGSYTYLFLIRPTDGKMISMLMDWDYTTTQSTPEKVIWSNNAGDADLAKEKTFLEAIRYNFGYLTDQDILNDAENPEYALHLWGMDNGTITNGTMNIRSFAGKPDRRNSVNDSLNDGDVIYTAYFKGPVIAYDVEEDIYRILFHPYNHYDWPESLAKYKDWLIIGTRGEGLALVNTTTNYLKRIDTEWGSISELKIEGTKLIINDRQILDLLELISIEEK